MQPGKNLSSLKTRTRFSPVSATHDTPGDPRHGEADGLSRAGEMKYSRRRAIRTKLRGEFEEGGEYRVARARNDPTIGGDLRIRR